MLNWVYDELFISSFAKECINSNEIDGLKFMNVINHKKNTIFDDFHQIYVESKLEPGMTDLNKSVAEYRNCNVCGSEKYIYSGRGLTFKKDVFKHVAVDILKTYESFGEGHICGKIIIISKKLYQIIKNNGLDKDLAYEPILLT